MAKLRQRQTVCGGAIRNQENFAVGFKKLAHAFANSLRPLIVAVRTRRAFVNCLQLRPGFRTNRGSVIARKFVTIDRSVHLALRTRFFRRRNRHAEPARRKRNAWRTSRALVSGIRQANHLYLLPNFMCSLAAGKTEAESEWGSRATKEECNPSPPSL